MKGPRPGKMAGKVFKLNALMDSSLVLVALFQGYGLCVAGRGICEEVVVVVVAGRHYYKVMEYALCRYAITNALPFSSTT